jgi:hypothetical protein
LQEHFKRNNDLLTFVSKWAGIPSPQIRSLDGINRQRLSRSRRRRGKRSRHSLDFLARQPMVCSDRPPRIYGGLNLPKNYARLRRREAVELRGGPGQRHSGRGIMGVDGQRVVGSFDIRIEIVGGREAPAVGRQNEAVVTEVIVAVGDEEIENEARPQLAQIFFLMRRATVRIFTR